MNANNAQPHEAGAGARAARDVFQERYYQAVREHESLEAEIQSRLLRRQENAAELRALHLKRVQMLGEDFAAEKQVLTDTLYLTRQDLEAAHRAAGDLCAEAGAQYVPGRTTAEDVLHVLPLPEGEAARRLGLPFGLGIRDRVLKIIKPLLALLCWLAASLSLGLGFRLLEARDVFGRPPMVCLSLVMGGMTSLGLYVALTALWRLVGAQVGSGRPAEAVFRLLVFLAPLTLALWMGLAYLDAKAVILLNAARAALNPMYAIPLSVALCIGMVISGVYVLGLAGTSFAASYGAAARVRVVAVIHSDGEVRRAERVRQVPVRKALEALADVSVAEDTLRRVSAEVKTLEESFKREHAQGIATTPDVPAELEPEEQALLADSRARLTAAKTRYEAYRLSRRVVTASRYSPVRSEEEEDPL